MATKMIDLSKYKDLLYDTSKNNENATPIYGPFEKQFIHDWGQSNIHHDIVQAFVKMNIRQMTPIQQNAFLNLMNNFNVAMIGFSKGKSTSYLASIMSSIMINNENIKDVAIGPKAIIITSSLGSCTLLENLSKELNSTTKLLKIVVTNSSISIQKTLANLCNGCDILIATPTSFHNLLNKTKLFSWLNLRHFVFDNLDLSLDNYRDQMFFCLENLMQLKENLNNIQLISASVKWSKDMDAFLNKLFVKWQYIFGSHLEAARYRRIGFNIVQVMDDKLKNISNYLKNNIKYRRCVLITSNVNILDTISSYIKNNDDDIEVLLPGPMKSNKVYISHEWDKPLTKSKLICICSDDMMSDFYIDNADCLIHYDIPVNKTTFSVRFSVLQDSSNLLTKKMQNTYVFLSNDNKDMLQLSKVVEIMKTFGNGEVDPILLKHSKIINETLEKEKLNRLFCDDLKQFGNCSKLLCQNRHILLKELDEPVNIPRSGLAIVKILNVYDASHMSAKLLKLNCSNNLNDTQHWSNVEDYSTIINFKLSSFYSNENSRIIHEKLNIGDIVTVHIKAKIGEHVEIEYFRAIVIEMVDEKTLNPKVMVKLIDQGFIEIVSKWNVYVLPDMLKSIHTNTVDIFLTSVKPIDFDKSWCSQANYSVKKQLKYAEDCSDTIIVKIKLALGNTIWIKKLFRKFWHSKLKIYDFETILPDFLLSHGYADINSDHIENLSDMIISAGISMPLTLMNYKENDELSLEEYMKMYKLPNPQWAHLNIDDVTLVSLDFIISPKLFFVRNSKFSDRLVDLEEKIEYYVKQKQVEKLKYIIKGAVCLAKNSRTDRFNRCQIIEVLKDKELVEVLFVDTGEFVYIKFNSLLTIHPNLIIQLPFQVIECSLSGICDTLPTGNELDELINYLYDLTQNILNLKVVDTLSAQFTNGSHYEVILYDESFIVNLEMQHKFNQYCNDTQMSKLEKLISDEDTSVKKNNPVPYIINEKKLYCGYDDNDIAAIDVFNNDFVLSVFGQSYNELLENIISNNENTTKNSCVIEETTTDLSVISQTENKAFENYTNFESPKEINSLKPNEEMKSVDMVVLNKPSVPKKHKFKRIDKRQNICLTCNTNVQSIIPVCIWYQDKNNIYLKFNILEIDDFNVNSTMKNVTFEAQFKDISYAFCAMLYGLIDENSIVHKTSFEGFHIKIEKFFKTEYKWPRLFACSKWHRYVKYDPEHIETKDLTVWLIMLKELKTLATGTTLNITDISSNSDSSSDYNDYNCDDIFL